MPTIKDVARLAQVTPATVSYVLNDSAPVSEATRLRVLAAVQELGYVPHQQGRNFQRQRTGTLGLILNSTSQTMLDLAPFLLACVDISQQHEYSLLVTATPKRGAADGWISFDPLIEPINPIIWAVQPRDSAAITVLCDGSAAVQRAMQTLIHTGRQRIAFVGLPRNEAGAGRWYLGYRRALRQAQIAFDPALVLEPHSNTLESGNAVWEMLSDHPPDAIIACSAAVAYGLHQAMHYTNASCELIAGHDHPLLAGAHISALQWDMQDWARFVVERLISLIEGHSIPQRTWLKPMLLVR